MVDITYDELIKNTINIDPIFKKFIEKIDLGFQNCIKTYSDPLNIKANMVYNSQDDSWHKIYLNIEIKDFDFDQNMHIWDRLDKFIRAEIESEIEKYQDNGEKKYLQDLNRRFFIILKI